MRGSGRPLAAEVSGKSGLSATGLRPLEGRGLGLGVSGSNIPCQVSLLGAETSKFEHTGLLGSGYGGVLSSSSDI